MLDVLQKTVRREGFLGLYKGVLPNLFKLAPAAGISWFTFEVGPSCELADWRFSCRPPRGSARVETLSE